MRRIGGLVLAVFVIGACGKKKDESDPMNVGRAPDYVPPPTKQPKPTGSPTVRLFADLATLPAAGGKVSPQSALAADDANLYALAYASAPDGKATSVLFVRIPLATGKPELVASQPDYHHVKTLTVADGSLHWLTGEGVGHVPLTGGAVTETVLGMHWGLLVDRGWMYSCTERDLERIKLDGSKREVLAQKTSCHTLAIAGDTLVWLDLSSRPSRLLRVPITGGTPEVLVANNDLAAMAVGGDRIFYSTRSSVEGNGDWPIHLPDAVIRSLPLSGPPTATNVLDQLHESNWLAADANYVYWGNSVARVKLDGSDARALLVYPQNAYGSMYDGTPIIRRDAIYWIDHDGKIFTAPNPP